MPWLIKSEPDTFSIHDLERVSKEPWTGVRNYQARNYMWKEMEVGDPALFYHSSTHPPAIAGLAKVASTPYPDPTQFDTRSEYHDPKSTKEKPRWFLVDFEHVATFPNFITLEQLKTDRQLSGMVVCQRGSRLSITPVENRHFQRVVKLAGMKG